MRTRITALALLLCLAPWVSAEEILRPPVAAGEFYPDDSDALLRMIRGFYNRAESEPAQGRLSALIVPHSGYDFAGAVMAHAFKDLKPGQYRRVVILAPSHYMKFDGCSIPVASGYVTPLGVVPLDVEAIDRVIFSPLISTRALRYNRTQGSNMLHEMEHDIEVLLPFLQERLGFFYLVPILIGDLRDAQRRFSEGAIEAVAEAVKTIIDEDTLLIVSSDFTHFGNDFSYRPFENNVLPQIQELDEMAFRLIIGRNFDGFQNYLEQTRNTICGREAIQILLKLLPPRTVGRVLAYDLSARHTNNERRSVSYGAISFHDTSQPPLPARPARNPFAIPQAQVPGFRPGDDVAPLSRTEPDAERNDELRE